MALSIVCWTKYTDGNNKLMKKSENAVNCNRVLSFTYDSEQGRVSGSVQASMKDRSYKVEVRLQHYQTNS